MAQLKHIPALDGIRGLAVLAILLFHAGHITGGWLGVDLFFVLSGFLITSLLLAEHEPNGRIQLAAFWSRRARRLFPALIAVLLGVAAYTALFAEPEQYASIRGDGLATLFYVANLRAILIGHDYWSLFLAPSPLDHTWSLAIEEQFYLLWPPIVVVALVRLRWTHAALGRLAAIAALASVLWAVWLFDPAEGTARVYYGTDTRVSALLMGAFLATQLRPRMITPTPSARARTADNAALLALIALSIAWWQTPGDAEWVYRGGLFALNLLSGLIIAGAVVAPQGLAARFLSLAGLRWLGRISYGAYLWHWPLFLVLSPDRIGLASWPLTSLRIAVTLAVAEASYRWIEQPIRRGALSPAAAFSAAAASAVLVVAALIAATPRREDIANDAAEADTTARVTDVVLIGDSVAQKLANAFRREARTRKLSTRVFAEVGCLVMVGSDVRLEDGTVWKLEGPCRRLRTRRLEYLKHGRPQRVLFLEGSDGSRDRRVGGQWVHACQPVHDSAHQRDLEAEVRRFQAAGARAAIALTSPPDIPQMHPNNRGRFPDKTDAQLGELMRERVGCLNATQRAVARATGAATIALDEWVAGHPSSAAIRSDGIHFKKKGAVLASRFLLDALDKALPPTGADASKAKAVD